MPTLNWIGKDKITNHDKDVPFRLLKKNNKLSLGQSDNLVVEGDNLEALKALMPFYYNKVKCIYIDPPYNTGNEGWVYNDRVNSTRIQEWLGKAVGPEGEDLTRHDKWLCMMYPRLKLLKDLLRDDGVIFISIDDNEHCSLRMIVDEIFGIENFVESFIWKSRLGKGATSQTTAKLHEYVVAYAKNIQQLEFKTDKRISVGEAKERLRQWGQGDRREDRPTMYYSVYSKKFGKVYPIRPDGSGGRWRISKNKMEELISGGSVIFEKQKDGRIEAYRIIPSGSETNTAYSSILNSDIVKTTAHGSTELKEVFGKQIFAYPKPASLIKELVSLCAEKDKEAIILDSFAGSGTTGHAVLELNKEDGGNRKFILVEMEEKIAKEITSERMRRVIGGYSYKTNSDKSVKVAGLGGGFEYVELGSTLFSNAGAISDSVKYFDLASYVFFTETLTNLEKRKVKEPYLGNFADSDYYLLFTGKDKNILDRKFLKQIQNKTSRNVIYADKCLLDEDMLEKYQIIFKQIPYQIKVY